MAKPWDVTSDDIDLWSQRIEAPALLPDLVHQLLLATAPLASSRAMHGAAVIHLKT